jgi:hypothetical protein
VELSGEQVIAVLGLSGEQVIAVLGLSGEQLIAVLGLLVGGIAGFGGPLLTARYARERQEKELADQRERLEITLAADRRKALIDERRKLLDEGAVLLVEADRALRNLLLDRDVGEPKSSGDWDDFERTLGRFQARLALWFDEGSDVIESFARALHALVQQRTGVEGRLRALNRMLDHLPDSDDPQLASKQTTLVEQRDSLIEEATARVSTERRAFVRAARVYLAGETPTTRA